jgi:hypothetical protein
MLNRLNKDIIHKDELVVTQAHKYLFTLRLALEA